MENLSPTDNAAQMTRGFIFLLHQDTESRPTFYSIKTRNQGQHSNANVNSHCMMVHLQLWGHVYGTPFHQIFTSLETHCCSKQSYQNFLNPSQITHLWEITAALMDISSDASRAVELFDDPVEESTNLSKVSTINTEQLSVSWYLNSWKLKHFCCRGIFK